MGAKGAGAMKKASSRKASSPATSKPGMFERIKNMFNEFI
jgi:cell division protein FtsA